LGRGDVSEDQTEEEDGYIGDFDLRIHVLRSAYGWQLVREIMVSSIYVRYKLFKR
jgi:hypothetical protein